jgi:hypothetical protein
VITIVITVIIVGTIVRRRKDLTQEFGISGKTYLLIVFIVEIFYTIGLILILSALGINILSHLQALEFTKFIKTLDSVDLTKAKFIGTLGWIGLGMNVIIAFIAPCYLLIKGGKKLPKIIRYPVYTEITLELIIIFLVAVSLSTV